MERDQQQRNVVRINLGSLKCNMVQWQTTIHGVRGALQRQATMQDCYLCGRLRHHLVADIQGSQQLSSLNAAWGMSNSSRNW
eukprot:scaffold15735_cov21-Prasinocladus_malaysianus.AAC.1